MTVLISLLLSGLAWSAAFGTTHLEPYGWPTGPHAPPTVRMHRISLRTGVSLDVAEAGSPVGEPVLFLHGYTDSWHSFSPVLEHLPPGIRAIVPSQRGHGDSDRPECCYGFPVYAADAVALLDVLGIRRATVVGHSMGSFVAQRMAITHPERVSRLVLVGSGPTYRVEGLLDLAELASTLENPVPQDLVREFQVSTTARPLDPDFLDLVIAESRKMPARIWSDVIDAQLTTDAAGELEAITAPTLVLWGDRDGLFFRPDQDALVARIQNARLVAYPEVGHGLHWEEPGRFVRDLEAFLIDTPQ